MDTEKKAGLLDFVGTWRAAPGAPHSRHTFTWAASGEFLQGEWVVEAASRPDPLKAVVAPLHMQIGQPWLDDGRLLFHVNNGPHVWEFRVVGSDEAVVGTAVDQLPVEFAGPDFQRSIEKHRVLLQRQPAPAA